jgi:hypothetical protein
MIGVLLLCTAIESALLYLVRKTWLIFPLVILFLFLLLFLFVLPPYFTPEPKEGGVNCGLPVIANIMLFWMYGILTTVGLTLVVLLFQAREVNRRKDAEHQS